MNFTFLNLSYPVWIGNQRHVTLGFDKRNQLHLVQMQNEQDKYMELRSIGKLGHTNLDDKNFQLKDSEREARESHRTSLKQELLSLKKQK